MAKDKAPTHSGAVYCLLADLWPKGAYAIMPEVGNATGGHVRRHADAVVMSLWPSRGLTVMGVEIKVSRSDWLAELRNGAKAEAVAEYCDQWYVAVSRASIIAEGELPQAWGLIACDSGKAKVIKQAPTLTPKPLDRGFVAAMLRRASEFITPDQWVKDKLAQERAIAEEKARELAQDEIEKYKQLAERLAKTIAEFESKTGVTITRYTLQGNHETFQAVKRAIEAGDVDMDFQAARMERAARLMREAAQTLKATAQGTPT
jgi:hypothetical protein